MERIFFKNVLDKNKFKFLNHIYLMFVVIIGWMFFRANTLKEALNIILLMFNFNFNEVYTLLPTIINSKTILIIIVSILLCGPIQMMLSKIKKTQKIVEVYKNLEFIVIAFIMFISILELVASTYNPFIYFRF